MKRKLMFHLMSIFLIMIFGTTASYGSETWISFKSDNLGQFISKTSNGTYSAVSFPIGDGLLLNETTYQYIAKEGYWQVGLQRHEFFGLDYNHNAAQFAYYLLRKEPLPTDYVSINWDLLWYEHEDLLIDWSFSQGKHWRVDLGYRLLSAGNLLRFKVMEAQATQAVDELTHYDLYGYTTLWRSNQKSGFGTSYAVSVQYTPQENWSLYLAGDDLFGKIHWQGISIHHGIIDLDVIKQDDDGLDTFNPPIRGNEYTHDGILLTEIIPNLRGGVCYSTHFYQMEAWLRYHQFWELGLKGTYNFAHLPPLTVGCLYREGKIAYLIGTDTEFVRFQLSVNRLKETTDASFGIEFHLF